MLYIKPDYYPLFHCTADKCEATCCAGWQIVVDEDSLARYKEESGAYGDILRSRIDWEEGIFKQDKCKRCAFLKENGLCEMYEKLGEESLCVTCTNYPRHIEEFENIREITLAISCPEAAHIILSKNAPVRFVEEEVEEEEEEFEDFDPFFFSYLEDGRRLALKLLQNRELSVAVRFGLVKQLARDMQETLEEAELYELADVLETYEDAGFLAGAMGEITKKQEEMQKEPGAGWRYSKAMFGRLYELEHLSDSWEPYLEQCWETLYGQGAENYVRKHREFAVYCGLVGAESRREAAKACNRKQKEAFGTEAENIYANDDTYDMDVILEQLLVYFIFTYFCGAVYDDNVQGKVELALTSVFCLYEMFVVKWTEQGWLCLKDIERIVYRYSRELEHSDENLEKMEQYMC